jgi:hypothetical protein
MINQAPDPMIPHPFCIEVAAANGTVDTSFAWGRFNKEVLRGEHEAHEN